MKWSWTQSAQSTDQRSMLFNAVKFACQSKFLKNNSVFLVMAGDAESMEKFSRRLVSYI